MSILVFINKIKLRAERRVPVEIQLSFWEAIMDLLYLNPLYFIGLAFIILSLYYFLKRENERPKIRVVISSILLYYYLCIVLTHIVRIPTLNEFARLTRLGESFFNPNLNLIPFVQGINSEFMLNILLFIPLGFLLPIINKAYAQIKKVVLLGGGLSLIIEISQLFTLFRATDINDLIANTLGAVMGWLCFVFILKFGFKQSRFEYMASLESQSIRFLSILIILVAFIFTFIL